MQTICFVSNSKCMSAINVDTRTATPLFLFEQCYINWLDGTPMLNGRCLEFFELAMTLDDLGVREDCKLILCPRKIGKDGLI